MRNSHQTFQRQGELLLHTCPQVEAVPLPKHGVVYSNGPSRESKLCTSIAIAKAENDQTRELRLPKLIWQNMSMLLFIIPTQLALNSQRADANECEFRTARGRKSGKRIAGCHPNMEGDVTRRFVAEIHKESNEVHENDFIFFYIVWTCWIDLTLLAQTPIFLWLAISRTNPFFLLKGNADVIATFEVEKCLPDPI